VGNSEISPKVPNCWKIAIFHANVEMLWSVSVHPMAEIFTEVVQQNAQQANYLCISSRFFQHFAILLYIVLIQLFLLPEQINHYYLLFSQTVVGF